jgi:site-specific recombinase XerD
MPRGTASKAAGSEALLSEAEVQRLLLAASERAPTGVRNRALIALLYCTGLRLGEALALAPRDVDLAAGTVAVKGPRERAAHLFPSAVPYLETWQSLRAELDLPARAALFCTLAGEPLEPAYVRAMLTRLGRRAGLAKRVHAHLLRHSAAARMGRAGLAAGALASQLGHRATRSTRRALAGFGVALAARGRGNAAELAWSLAPEPGAVRARVVLGRRPARGEAKPPARGGVVVRRWRPEEL